ncbi:MAG: IS66 C-terminal element [Glomeribacter sp. 1016415]|nr:IS66 C-terminal element [Glomeribacter sp. 1016415]
MTLARNMIRQRAHPRAELLCRFTDQKIETMSMNRTFNDTVAGARASSIIYSIMLTCRASQVEPYAYLCHVLTELPKRQPEDDISDLLPFNFHTSSDAS